MSKQSQRRVAQISAMAVILLICLDFVVRSRPVPLWHDAVKASVGVIAMGVMLLLAMRFGDAHRQEQSRQDI